MLNHLKKEIINNPFIDELKTQMQFNDHAYVALIFSLTELSVSLKNRDKIDKELALYLYTIPQMVRNIYSSFDAYKDKPTFIFKLENAWIELDALSIKCLS